MDKISNNKSGSDSKVNGNNNNNIINEGNEKKSSASKLPENNLDLSYQVSKNLEKEFDDKGTLQVSSAKELIEKLDNKFWASFVYKNNSSKGEATGFKSDQDQLNTPIKITKTSPNSKDTNIEDMSSNNKRNFAFTDQEKHSTITIEGEKMKQLKSTNVKAHDDGHEGEIRDANQSHDQKDNFAQDYDPDKENIEEANPHEFTSKSNVDHLASRKKWSIVEDLILLDFVKGKTNLQSKLFWRNALIDKKIKEINRTPESMRDRYRNCLKDLNQNEIKKIEDFLRQHGIGFLIFVNSIEKNKNGELISRKKLENIIKLTQVQISMPTFHGKKLEKPIISSTKKMIVEDQEFKSKDLIPSVEVEKEAYVQAPVSLSADKKETSMTGLTKEVNKAEEKSKIDGTVGDSIEKTLPYKKDKDIIIDEERVNWKRKSYEHQPARADHDLKRVKPIEVLIKENRNLSQYYKEMKTLPEMIYNKKIKIFLDPESSTRRIKVEEKKNHLADKSSTQELSKNAMEIQAKLQTLALRYSREYNEVKDIFYKVSCIFDTLKEVLKMGDEKLMWTDEQDEELRENNPKIMKYLIKEKGQESVKNRRKYLGLDKDN